MAELNSPEIEIEDESDDLDEPNMVEPFNPSEIKVLPVQDTLVNLIGRLKHSEIELNTDFQRHGELWDNGKMSRLIESILIRFPLPAFYFDATNDDCWQIVDGLQRLSSIKKFVIESDKKKCLHLSKLEYLKDLKGLSFDDLNRGYKRRINECPITYFKILPGTPDEVKYSIFRRINTGGLTLNNQEIRNAMANEDQRKFLRELAKDSNLKATMGDQSKRMIDQELVLRFLAFYHKDYMGNKKNIAEFLDEMLNTLGAMNELDRNKLKKAFTESMKRSYDLFGDSAFEKRSEGDENGRRKRKNTTLFEVWSVSLARLSKEDTIRLIEKRQMVEQLHLKAMDPGGSYYRSISLATQKRDHVKIRYQTVEEIIRETLHD